MTIFCHIVQDPKMSYYKIVSDSYGVNQYQKASDVVRKCQISEDIERELSIRKS